MIRSQADGLQHTLRRINLDQIRHTTLGGGSEPHVATFFKQREQQTVRGPRGDSWLSGCLLWRQQYVLTHVKQRQIKLRDNKRSFISFGLCDLSKSLWTELLFTLIRQTTPKMRLGIFWPLVLFYYSIGKLPGSKLIMCLLCHYLFGIVAKRAETKAAAILSLLLFLISRCFSKRATRLCPQRLVNSNNKAFDLNKHSACDRISQEKAGPERQREKKTSRLLKHDRRLEKLLFLRVFFCRWHRELNDFSSCSTSK